MAVFRWAIALEEAIVIASILAEYGTLVVVYAGREVAQIADCEGCREMWCLGAGVSLDDPELEFRPAVTQSVTADDGISQFFKD